MAITRHGVNRQDVGPLMRCSFEETVDILMTAAAHSELDKMQGVSENIIVGQMMPGGTGHFDLMLSAERCKSAMEIGGGGMDHLNLVGNSFFNMNSPSGGGFSPGGTGFGQTPGSQTPVGIFGSPNNMGMSPTGAFSPAQTDASGMSPGNYSAFD